MTITYKNGNAVSALIDGEIQTLLHVCNNKGVMGSGIALEIKNRIPDAYKCYKVRQIIDGMNLPLGSISIGTCSKESGDTITFYGKVFNMVAQDGYGKGIRRLNYGALADCLLHVAEHRSYSGDIIGIPYLMGSDRAGGDWNIVLELVEYFLKDFNVIIYKLEE